MRLSIRCAGELYKGRFVVLIRCLIKGVIMSDYLIRGTAADLMIRAFAVDVTDTV